MALCDLMYVVDGGAKKAGTVDTAAATLAVTMGTAAAVGTLELLGVYVHQGTQSKSGYMKKSDVDALNPGTVSIPENFAGLEAEMVPTRLQDQLFRVVDVVETEDYVEVTARHVWYDNLKNYTLWEPNADTDYTGAAVCRNILSNAISPVDSRVASDCTDTKKGDQLDFVNKNLVECFLDPENGVCAQFDLSLIRDNWDFYCLKTVGYDRGFVVEDGKNLLGVERKESIENLATRVAPFGKDKKGKIVWLNHNGLKYVDSQYIGDYSCPHVELYDTGLQIGKDGVTAQNIQEKLLAAGEARFTEDHVDLPNVEMTIQFLSIGDTEEYAQYRDLDKVYLYDIITIHDKVRGYSYTAQVVGIEHDILTGMLNSVTIGKLDNWDGTRKIATWQVPEVNGENIRLLSIQAGAFEPGAIYGEDIAEAVISYAHFAAATINSLKADSIDAVTANIQTIIAGQITADSIDTNSIAAINAKLGTAQIADAEIAIANIGFAQIKDADVQNLIARDAVTDRYYIHKLAVDNAQLVYATVGELVVKATDNKYYRLDINAQGQLSPTEVTLTAGEITAGITSDGHASIIETDLTVTDLSAANMKGISALIDKITASRIDVDELFARTAFINKLNTTDITGNGYLQIMVENFHNTYVQLDDPSLTHTMSDGDVWYKTAPPDTNSEMSSYSNQSLSSYTNGEIEGAKQYVWKDGTWTEYIDPSSMREAIARIQVGIDTITLSVTGNSGAISTLQVQLNTIELSVADKYGHVSGIEITANGIEVSGSKYVKIKSGGSFTVDSGNFSIDTSGNVTLTGTITAGAGSTIGGWTLGANRMSSGSGSGYVAMDSDTSGTYAIWAGNGTASSAPFRVQRDGTVYLTQLVSLDENGSPTTVNLRTTNLWKLNYSTIKSYTATSITLTDGTTINFTNASSASIQPDGAGSVYIMANSAAVSGTSKAVTVAYDNTGTPSYSSGLIHVPIKAVLAGTQTIGTGYSVSCSDGAGDGLAYDAGASAGQTTGWSTAYGGSECIRSGADISVKIPSTSYGAFSPFSYQITVDYSWRDVGHLEIYAKINGITVDTDTVRANQPT